MEKKFKMIYSFLLVFVIIGIIAWWEVVKPDKPDVTFVIEQESHPIVKEQFDTVGEASDAYLQLKEFNGEELSTHISNIKEHNANVFPAMLVTKEKVKGNEKVNMIPYFIVHENGKYHIEFSGKLYTSDYIVHPAKESGVQQELRNKYYRYTVSKHPLKDGEFDERFKTEINNYHVGLKVKTEKEVNKEIE